MEKPITYRVLDILDFEYDYYSKAWYKALIYNILIFFIISVLIVIISLLIHNLKCLFFILILIIIQRVTFRYLNFFFRKKMPDWNIYDKIIGEIKLNKDSIEYDNKVYDFENIEKLILKNGRYRIEKYSDLIGMNWMFNFEFMGNGISKFIIKQKNKEEIEIKFIVEGEYNYIRLKNLLRIWYYNHYEIEESFFYNKYDKTFLFENYDKWDLKKIKDNLLK